MLNANIMHVYVPLINTPLINTSLFHTTHKQKQTQEDKNAVLQHPLFTWLTQQVNTNIHKFQARQLANISWAIASLGADQHKGLLGAAVDSFVMVDLGGCTDQELSNVAWV